MSLRSQLALNEVGATEDSASPETGSADHQDGILRDDLKKRKLRRVGPKTLLAGRPFTGRDTVQTMPGETLRLDRTALRKGLGANQVDMALRLGVANNTISTFESQPNIRLSSLQNWVAALGGTLEISVLIHGKRVILTDLSD